MTQSRIEREKQELIRPTVQGSLISHPIDNMARDFQDICGYSEMEAYIAAGNVFEYKDYIVHA